MSTPTIEIYGTGTHNRGAELMAIAIAEKVREVYPDARIVVPPLFGHFTARARYGFHTTLELERNFLPDQYWKLAPRSMRRALGAVDPREIDVVLDASGFVFSDQWGAGEAKRLVSRMERRGNGDVPLVLLPQALGPFRDPAVRKWSGRLFERAALVCARDQASYDYVSEICPQGKLRRFPDFTVSVKPTMPTGGDSCLPERFAAIVPNVRMCDKGDGKAAYLPFLARTRELVEAAGLEPVFVVHDAAHDKNVLLEAGLGDSRIFEHSDPRVLKGVLGSATFIVGSRFHALVSGLSQGVPCIAAGWSHKYPELLKDYGCTEFLANDLRDFGHIEGLVESLSNDSSRTTVEEGIQQALTGIKGELDELWRQVFSIVKCR